MNLRLASLSAALLCLAACTSYRSTQVRVMSGQGGGIGDAEIRFDAERSNEGDGALRGRQAWRTDAAGRATIDYKGGGNGGHWHIEAEGFRPLDVNASPDEIRVKQYGNRSKNHDAEPLIFTLEPKSPEESATSKPVESEARDPKSEQPKAAPKAVKKPKFEA